MELGISIIVCCYNSAKRLPETINHLALQQVPANVKWEIIIVDNASTDDTMQVAANEWKKYDLKHPQFFVVDEPKPGLSHAREKGISEAKYEYLLFCDDDNWLYPDYVSLAYHVMCDDPQIGVLGGCGIVEPEQPISLPIEEIKRLVVNGPQTWAAAQHWVYGAGAVYRKSVLVDLKKRGWNQISSDRIGKKLLSGGDVEICFMFYLAGYRIATDDKLLFKHFVPLKRQKSDNLIEASYWDGYTNVLLNSYYPILNHDKRPIEEIINKWLLSSTVKLIKGISSLFYNKLKTLNRVSIKQKIAFNYNYGTWTALLQNRKKIIDQNKQVTHLLAS